MQSLTAAQKAQSLQRAAILMNPESLKNLQKWAAVVQDLRQRAVSAQRAGQRYIRLTKSAASQRWRPLPARRSAIRRALSAGVDQNLAADAAVVAQSLQTAKSIAPSVRSAAASVAWQSARPGSASTSAASRSPRQAPVVPRESLETSKTYYLATAAQVLLAAFPYVATSAMTQQESDMYWIFASSEPSLSQPLLDNLQERLKEGVLDSIVLPVLSKMPRSLQHWILKKYVEMRTS